MRKKPNLDARLLRCAEYQIIEPNELRGRWLDAARQTTHVEVELGCGKGRFTCGTAAADPARLLVAIERVPDVAVLAMERAQAAELGNVRFIIGDVTQLAEIFAPGEVSRIYINFCDPWPGAGHRKRRLTHDGFLALYRSVLAPGGEIHFKTDNRDLFEFSVARFRACGFELSEVTRDLHADGICGIMTDYEEKFHAQGVPINRLVAAVGENTMVPGDTAAFAAPFGVKPEIVGDAKPTAALDGDE